MSGVRSSWETVERNTFEEFVFDGVGAAGGIKQPGVVDRHGCLGGDTDHHALVAIREDAGFRMAEE